MFNVKIRLFFILFDESQENFKVYLDDDGNYPEIDFKGEEDVNALLFNTANDSFYNFQHNPYMLPTLNKVEYSKDVVRISYNILCENNFTCKSGKFVKFDKPSIELYRFAKHRGV